MNKILSIILLITFFAQAETSKTNIEDYMFLDDLVFYWMPKKDDKINYPPGNIYLRKKFEIPKNAVVDKAYYYGSADDAFKLFVNGMLCGEADNHQRAFKFGIEKALQSGENIITIEAKNKGTSPNPAGIIGKMVIGFKNQNASLIIPLNKDWRISDKLQEGWKERKFDDKNWKSPEIIAGDGKEIRTVLICQNEPGTYFPDFIIPGYSNEMKRLRELYSLHFQSEAPPTTIWDSWIPMSVLWAGLSEKDAETIQENFKTRLLKRRIDDKGYVATHQHYGMGHPDGWPFPLWFQIGGMGWHFRSMEGLLKSWGAPITENTNGWIIEDAEKVKVDNLDGGLFIKFKKKNGYIISPKFPRIVKGISAPLIRIEWQEKGIPKDAKPYIEWTTKSEPEFSSERRIYFDPISPDSKKNNRLGETFTTIYFYKHPKWNADKILTRFKINFANNPGAEIKLSAVFTAPDTRHNVNNANYINGCEDYFNLTGDTDFLKTNITRIRKVMNYAIDTFQTKSNKCINTPWIGHDGRTGLIVKPDGAKTIFPGVGVGNNYWDLLPFGGKDALATIYFYDSLLALAKMEREIEKNPEWGIKPAIGDLTPKQLLKHAAEIKKNFQKIFWNTKTKRFVPSIDINGDSHDFGLTFLNLEAIYYGLASKKQAKEIMSWISGKRIVQTDTSKGKDIYRFKFAPRATTKRNIEYYSCSWINPETIPFGNQVQDGGAVLGFSFHDLMARLKVYGPDDAWQRLKEIMNWFDEVQKEGGYRKYYENRPDRGTLQGGGPPGGLGMDKEFIESILLPQVMLYGFMGFEPEFDGFKINPRLPRDWPSLTITRVKFQDAVLELSASKDRTQIEVIESPVNKIKIFLPTGKWKVNYKNADGKIIESKTASKEIPLQIKNSRFVEIY